MHVRWCVYCPVSSLRRLIYTWCKCVWCTCGGVYTLFSVKLGAFYTWCKRFDACVVVCILSRTLCSVSSLGRFTHANVLKHVWWCVCIYIYTVLRTLFSVELGAFYTCKCFEACVVVCIYIYTVLRTLFSIELGAFYTCKCFLAMHVWYCSGLSVRVELGALDTCKCFHMRMFSCNVCEVLFLYWLGCIKLVLSWGSVRSPFCQSALY